MDLEDLIKDVGDQLAGLRAAVELEAELDPLHAVDVAKQLLDLIRVEQAHAHTTRSRVHRIAHEQGRYSMAYLADRQSVTRGAVHQWVEQARAQIAEKEGTTDVRNDGHLD